MGISGINAAPFARLRQVILGGALWAGLAAAAHAGVCAGTPATASTGAVTYLADVITDVSLAGKMYRSADVTFTYRGNLKDVFAFDVTAPDGNEGSGQCLETGTASVSIKTAGATTVTATFLPGQVFVAFDTYNNGIGFSSYTGPNGLEPVYPLGFLDGTVGQFTVDLITPVNISGKAWSCIGYPPLFNSGTCLDPTQYPLKTNRGDFVIFMPFQHLDATTGLICCDFGGSLNRGTFSVVLGRPKE